MENEDEDITGPDQELQPDKVLTPKNIADYVNSLNLSMQKISTDGLQQKAFWSNDLFRLSKKKKNTFQQQMLRQLAS